MNKNDLIASVASSAGLSKSDATRAIESFLDAITNSLKRDEKVSVRPSARHGRKRADRGPRQHQRQNPAIPAPATTPTDGAKNRP